MKKECAGGALRFAFGPFAIAAAVLTGKPLLAGLPRSVMPAILGMFPLVKGLRRK